MNEFVERCRAEWRRLVGADPLADEMAADPAAITVIVAGLLLATGEPKMTLMATGAAGAHFPGPGLRAQASAAAPVEWILLVVALAALGLSARLWLRWDRSRPASG